MVRVAIVGGGMAGAVVGDRWLGCVGVLTPVVVMGEGVQSARAPDWD